MSPTSVISGDLTLISSPKKPQLREYSICTHLVCQTVSRAAFKLGHGRLQWHRIDDRIEPALCCHTWSSAGEIVQVMAQRRKRKPRTPRYAVNTFTDDGLAVRHSGGIAVQ